MVKTLWRKLRDEDAQLTMLEAVAVSIVVVLVGFLLCFVLQAVMDGLNLPEWMFIHHDCPDTGVCL